MLRIVSEDDVRDGLLSDPSGLLPLSPSEANAPSVAGFVALDGLSDTAFVLFPQGRPPLPDGWHVFTADADEAGVGAMMRVARTLAPLRPEDEEAWLAWLRTNPTKDKYIDATPSNR